MIDGLHTLAHKYADAPDAKEKLELYLNTWWRPQLTLIGIEGLPNNLSLAGNVVVKSLKFRMSMRLAPTHDSKKVVE